MGTLKITEDDITKIILGRVNAEGEKYWIKAINRALPSTLQGTIVEVAPIEVGGGGNSKVTFDKFTINIEGELSKYADEINQDYVVTMCEIQPEFKKFYDKSMEAIEEKTRIFKQRLLEEFNRSGYVKNDIKCILTGTGVKDLAQRLEAVKHGEFIAPISNKYDKSNREFKKGEIYFANLNPALVGEFAGVRPVVIVASNDSSLTILPLTSKLEQKSNGEYHVLIKADKYDAKNFTDSIVCTEIVKTIDKSRIYNKLLTLDEEDLNQVIDLMGQRLFGDKYLAPSDEYEAYDIFSEEEVEKFEREQELEEKKKAEQATLKQDKTLKPSNTFHTVEKFINNPQSECTIGEILYGIKEEKVEDKNFICVVDNSVKKTPAVIYELTDEEAIQICEQKFEGMRANGSRLSFQDPIVLSNNSLQEGIKIAYNTKNVNGKEGKYYTEISLSSFYGTYECGSKKNNNDMDLTLYLASKMVEKYGDHYKNNFCKNYVKYFNRFYEYNGDLNKNINLLDYFLSFVGKKANNTNELVINGLSTYDYYSLEDITQEEQQ